MSIQVLFLNPFQFGQTAKNVGVDPVVSRHAGQEIKTGVTFPLGLAYMAAVLEKNRIETNILDPLAKQVSTEEIENAVDKHDFIVTPYSSHNFSDLQKLTEKFPTKNFILVGEISRYMYSFILNALPNVVIIFGEPENSLLKLVTLWPNFKSEPGLIYKEANGKTVVNPGRELVKNIDEFPFPKRDFIAKNDYWDISFWGQPTAYILPSRGCPYRCVFCISDESDRKQVRRRSAQNIVDELESIVATHGIKNFHFFDDTFNSNDKFVISVCQEIIERKLKIKWACGARPDIIRLETAKLMKQSGCIELQIGLESTNDSILTALDKDMKFSQAKKGIEILDNIKLPYSIHLILGSPGETRETIKKTQTYIKSLNPKFISYNVLTPLPGSNLFNKEVADHGLPELSEISKYDILHSEKSYCEIPVQELQQLIRSNYIDYYFSFHFISLVLKESLKSPKSFFYMAKTLYFQGIFFLKSIVFQLGS